MTRVQCISTNTAIVFDDQEIIIDDLLQLGSPRCTPTQVCNILIRICMSRMNILQYSSIEKFYLTFEVNKHGYLEDHQRIGHICITGSVCSVLPYSILDIYTQLTGNVPCCISGEELVLKSEATLQIFGRALSLRVPNEGLLAYTLKLFVIHKDDILAMKLARSVTLTSIRW